jgi:hypothetical protein
MQASKEVLALKFRMIRKYFIEGHTGRYEVQDDCHRPAHVPNARLAVADVRVEGNAVEL